MSTSANMTDTAETIDTCMSSKQNAETWLSYQYMGTARRDHDMKSSKSGHVGLWLAKQVNVLCHWILRVCWNCHCSNIALTRESGQTDGKTKWQTDTWTDRQTDKRSKEEGYYWSNCRDFLVRPICATMRESHVMIPSKLEQVGQLALNYKCCSRSVHYINGLICRVFW